MDAGTKKAPVKNELVENEPLDNEPLKAGTYSLIHVLLWNAVQVVLFLAVVGLVLTVVSFIQPYCMGVDCR